GRCRCPGKPGPATSQVRATQRPRRRRAGCGALLLSAASQLRSECVDLGRGQRTVAHGERGYVVEPLQERPGATEDGQADGICVRLVDAGKASLQAAGLAGGGRQSHVLERLCPSNWVQVAMRYVRFS